MAKKLQKASTQMKAIADPDTIKAIIRRRGDDGPPPRFRIEIGAPMSPAGLVSALVELHNYLNTSGPTDELSHIRRWLFNYVALYKTPLATEDKTPKLAFRTPYIAASDPFTAHERRSVAEALSLKKQIDMQVRALKARNIWS